MMEDSVTISDEDDDLPVTSNTLRAKGMCDSVGGTTKLKEGDFGDALVVSIDPHWQTWVVLHVEIYHVVEGE